MNRYGVRREGKTRKSVINSCVTGASIQHMTQHSAPMNMRVSQSVKDRVEAQAQRYDQTPTSLARMALTIGLEVLERPTSWTAPIPTDPGTQDTQSPGD